MRENGYPLHPVRGVSRRATDDVSAAASDTASYALKQNAQSYGDMFDSRTQSMRV